MLQKYSQQPLRLFHEETKKTGPEYQYDISATRLSARDPLGFPPHPHGWLSIIVYRYILN